MTSYAIESRYFCCANGVVDFPDGKSWSDVKYWYVKYGSFFATFNDGTSVEIHIDEEQETDWKRPVSTNIYPVSDEGWPDYEDLIEERE